MFKNVYKENLFIMKLLTTQPEFLEDIQRIRKKLEIPSGGFTNERTKNEWLGKNLNKLPANKKALMNESSIFYNAEILVKKYQLRYNFLHHIEYYIFYSKTDAPKFNFDVSIGPDPSGLRSKKWVSIKAYAPLTKDEIRQATKRLLKLQKEFLPPKVVLDLRPKVDIDLAIKIEQEMQKRIQKTEKRPDWYLEQVKKSYGTEVFEKTKKLHPQRMEKFVIHYTSREIAEKFLKTADKAPLVRKIYSSLQKKRKLLFSQSNLN